MLPLHMSDRRAIAVSTVWIACVQACLLAFVPAVWDDSDDVRMSMIAAGVGSEDGPSSSLVYINVVVGSVLKLLYTKMPDVTWYTWMHIAAHCVSLSTVSFAVIAVGVRRAALFAVAMMQVALASYFWTHLQFTTTAAMLAIAGMSLFVVGLSRSPTENRLRLLSAGSVLLTISSLVRLQSLQLVLVLSAVCVIAVAWEFRGQIRVVRDGLPVVVSALAICSAIFANSHFNRSDPEMAQFRNVLTTYAPIVNSFYVNELIGMKGPSPFVTEQDREEKQAQLETLGVSWNDLSCMMWWFLIDEDVFSVEQFAQLKKLLIGMPARRFMIMMAAVLPRILLQSHLFCLLAGVSIGLIFRTRLTRWRFSVCCVTWLVSLAVMVTLLSVLKLPDRVFISAGTVSCLATLLISCLRTGTTQEGLPGTSTPEPVDLGRRFPQVWLGAMALCGVFVTWQHVTYASGMTQTRQIVDSTIVKLVDRDDSLQVLLVPFPFAHLDPLDDQSNLGNWRFIYLDGHQRSPRQKSIIHRYLQQPLTDGFIKDKDLRLVVEPQGRSMAFIQAFYRDHYNLDVRFPIDEKLPLGTVRRIESRPVSKDADSRNDQENTEPPGQAAAVDVSGKGS
jgi:hypothetical protein